MRRALISLSFIMLVGCTFSPIPEATPTVLPVTVTPSTTPAPTNTLTPTPPPLETSQPIIQPSDTPLPPSATPTVTNTPGPFEHEIRPNEGMIEIVRDYGHRDLDVLSEVVRINDNIFNADLLPPPGSIILIPRPTATATVEGQAVADADPAQSLEQQAADLLTISHTVAEGETMVDIAQQYRTTLEILSQLNSPEIGFFGCDFDIPSGGPECNISLQIGQDVIVPAPTPTPTLSPTPSGQETATPTPTYSAPLVVFPPQDGIAAPGTFSLQWVSVGQLRPAEIYLVEVTDLTAEQSFAGVTRSTAYELPVELIPRTGETHQFEWTVSVATQNDAGQYRRVGSQSPLYRFQWQSAE